MHGWGVESEKKLYDSNVTLSYYQREKRNKICVPGANNYGWYENDDWSQKET